MTIGIPSLGKSGQCVKFTNHVHPVSQLRMSEVITLLRLYAFMDLDRDNFNF
jgi:hypothetical protein